MPAVTVEDITTLARLPEPGPQAVDRPVRSVTTAPAGYEGEGFPVRRAFAGVDLRDLDPVVHMDQMGEVEYAPGEPKGTAWHPRQRAGLRTLRRRERRHRGTAGAHRSARGVRAR
jgi:hypothetical protein